MAKVRVAAQVGHLYSQVAWVVEGTFALRRKQAWWNQWGGPGAGHGGWMRCPGSPHSPQVAEGGLGAPQSNNAKASSSTSGGTWWGVAMKSGNGGGKRGMVRCIHDAGAPDGPGAAPPPPVSSCTAKSVLQMGHFMAHLSGRVWVPVK